MSDDLPLAVGFDELKAQCGEYLYGFYRDAILKGLAADPVVVVFDLREDECREAAEMMGDPERIESSIAVSQAEGSIPWYAIAFPEGAVATMMERAGYTDDLDWLQGPHPGGFRVVLLHRTGLAYATHRLPRRAGCPEFPCRRRVTMAHRPGSLRALLVAVVALALLCVTFVRLYDTWARAAMAARMALQKQVTDTALFRFRDQLRLGGYGPISSHGAGGAAADNPRDQRWSAESEAWADRAGRGRPLIRLKVEGGSIRRSPGTIVVTDLGAPLNGQAIALLAAAYRERGWPYRVVAAPGARATPPAAGPGKNTGGPPR